MICLYVPCVGLAKVVNYPSTMRETRKIDVKFSK